MSAAGSWQFCASGGRSKFSRHIAGDVLLGVPLPESIDNCGTPRAASHESADIAGRRGRRPMNLPTLRDAEGGVPYFFGN